MHVLQHCHILQSQMTQFTRRKAMSDAQFPQVFSIFFIATTSNDKRIDRKGGSKKFYDPRLITKVSENEQQVDLHRKDNE